MESFSMSTHRSVDQDALVGGCKSSIPWASRMRGHSTRKFPAVVNKHDREFIMDLLEEVFGEKRRISFVSQTRLLNEPGVGVRFAV